MAFSDQSLYTKLSLGISVIVLLLAIVSVDLSAAPTLPQVLDVSWPNCHVLPPPSTSWGIVGVNGGLDFHINPCLATEAHWFSHIALYANTGYPGPNFRLSFHDYPNHCMTTDINCLAYNYGFNAATYTVGYANSQGIHSRFWWLDVETENSWTTDPLVNRAALQGMVDAIQQHVFLATVGFYSSPAQWQTITDGWQTGLPTWTATGSSERQVALERCQDPSFTGGTVWLTQYTPDLDNDYTCSNNLYKSLSHIYQ